MAHEIVEQHKDTLYQHAIRLLIPSHQTELSRTDSRQVGSASLLFMLMPHEHSYHSRVVVTRSTATAAAVVCHKECASAVCHRTIKILAVTESVLLLSLFVIKNVLLPLRVIRSCVNHRSAQAAHFISNMLRHGSFEKTHRKLLSSEVTMPLTS